MVPAVVGHEELSAVTRVVVAVGTPLISGGSRIAILARSWLKLADARIVPAREIQRRCDGNEFAPIHRANAWFFLDKRLELEAGVHRDQAHRQERQSRLRTFSRFVFKNAFLARRGADVGNGRQAIGACGLACGRRDNADAMQCRKVAVVDLSCDVVAHFHGQVVRLVNAVVHRHRPHPARHILATYRKHPGIRIDFFNRTAKRVLLFRAYWLFACLSCAGF